MPSLRKRKSTQQQIAEKAVGYLKHKTAGKAAKGAGKTAKGTAVYKVAAKRTPRTKRIPVIAAGAGIVALVATKLIKSRGGDPQTA